MNNRQGFTLIEAVICLALIALLSVGFLQMGVGSDRLIRLGREHSRASDALASAVEKGTLPGDVRERALGEQPLALSNDNGAEDVAACPKDDTLHLILTEQELYYPDQQTNGTFRYYR